MRFSLAYFYISWVNAFWNARRRSDLANLILFAACYGFASFALRRVGGTFVFGGIAEAGILSEVNADFIFLAAIRSFFPGADLHPERLANACVSGRAFCRAMGIIVTGASHVCA